MIVNIYFLSTTRVPFKLLVTRTTFAFTKVGYLISVFANSTPRQGIFIFFRKAIFALIIARIVLCSTYVI